MHKLRHRLEIQGPLNISVPFPETLFFFVTSGYHGESTGHQSDELDARITQPRINYWETSDKISKLRDASAYPICEMGEWGPTV